MAFLMRQRETSSPPWVHCFERMASGSIFNLCRKMFTYIIWSEMNLLVATIPSFLISLMAENQTRSDVRHEASERMILPNILLTRLHRLNSIFIIQAIQRKHSAAVNDVTNENRQHGRTFQNIVDWSTYRLVLTAMAANESVWVRPSEKRVRAQILYEGREASTKVMANENSVAISKMVDSSRPEALITGVCRCRQKTNATSSDNKIPDEIKQSTLIPFQFNSEINTYNNRATVWLMRLSSQPITPSVVIKLSSIVR